MSLRINTNLASINAQRQLANQETRKVNSMKSLASGSRINSAADDAAGLAISENLKANNRGNRVAKRNAEDAVSLIQVAEGGLNEINNIMVRLRELGVQSASDTIGDQEREFINKEAEQLLEEVDRIAASTKFGERNLLDGSDNELEFQVGVDGSESSIMRYSSDADATTSGLSVSGLDLSDKSSARDALETLDDALNMVGAMRSQFGAVQNRLDSTIANLDTSYENLSAANSRIRDADIAEESAQFTSAQILQQASVSMLAQANQSQANALSLL